MANKPFLSFQDQAKLLVRRGMGSRAGLSHSQLIDAIESDLRFINYYRFSAYWYPFRIAEENGSKSDFLSPGTCWETVRAYYMFDRLLRSLIFDAISRIEVALRTQIAHIWARETKTNTPQSNNKSYRRSFSKSDTTKGKKSYFAEFLNTIDKYYKHSDEDFAKHYRQHHGIDNAKDLPIWVFVEFTTFGNLALLLERGLPHEIVDIIASNFGFNERRFFVSCVNLLNDVRNTCAHQGRIWNKQWMSAKAANLLKYSQSSEWNAVWNIQSQSWQSETNSSSAIKLHKDNTRTAAILTVCHMLHRFAAPQSEWKQRLEALITDNPKSPDKDMYKHLGFSHPMWHTHPLWQ
ncbi:MAG: Abi family protein [Akkermansia sp.]|nr:Abi family protein [Akkermansia sp.]